MEELPKEIEELINEELMNFELTEGRKPRPKEHQDIIDSIKEEYNLKNKPTSTHKKLTELEKERAPVSSKKSRRGKANFSKINIKDPNAKTDELYTKVKNKINNLSWNINPDLDEITYYLAVESGTMGTNEYNTPAQNLGKIENAGDIVKLIKKQLRFKFPDLEIDDEVCKKIIYKYSKIFKNNKPPINFILKSDLGDEYYINSLFETALTDLHNKIEDKLLSGTETKTNNLNEILINLKYFQTQNPEMELKGLLDSREAALSGALVRLKEKQLKKLEITIEDFKIQLNKTENEIKEKNENLGNLTNELESQGNKNKILEGNLEAKNKEIQKIKQSNIDLEEKLANVKNQSSLISKEYGRLQSEFDTKTEELQFQINENKIKKENLEARNKETKKIEEKNKSLQEDLANAEEKFSLISENYKRLQSEFNTESKKLESQLNENKTLKQTNINLQEQLANAKNNFSSISEEYNRLRSALEDKLNVATPEQIEKLANDIDKLKKDLDEIRFKGFTGFLKQFQKIIILIVTIIMGSVGITGLTTYELTKEQEKKYGITTERLHRKLELGHFNDPKVIQIRKDFIEKNKKELDSLTNESVRKNPKHRELLKQALSLAYIPKNITFK